MSELTEDQYRRLKREVESSRDDAQRAQGALDQLMEQLKRDFDCDTLKEAKAKLEELEQKRDRLHSKLEKAMEDYEKSWKSQPTMKKYD